MARIPEQPTKKRDLLSKGVDEVLVTRSGLLLPERMDYEAWERAGGQLARISNASAWCLGDWMLYGAATYANRYVYAIEKVGLEYQTLRNYAWVARSFPPERRRPELSFQHHCEVASLAEPEQEMWLSRAEGERWSRNKLRRSIRQARSTTTDPVREKAAIPRISAPADNIEFWKSAATLQGKDFTKWIVEVLDDAASQTLAER
ncbi:LmbU family transcriptional regulator [Actinokineospora guangxiensis]|uniref:LmbU family transcriptional regulator n=1 Tax=Actinokineospora guangxiensis TaxID=1490288 RepID=A0ABW0ESF3_9PSEU